MTGSPRPDPPLTGDERSTLEGFLDYQRSTLAMKCEGVAAGDLRRRGVPPSSLSLLGIVRHMAEVERSWFRQRLAGEAIADRWITDDAIDADFDDVDTADVAEAFAAWAEECDRSRAITAATALDATFDHPRIGPISLRWLLAHMIEEYARHNGHADLLRERIDGAVGE